MPAATLLRQARQAEQLAQATVARRARVPQPRISEIERGKNDPGVGRLEALLAATRHRLVLVPTTTPTVAEAADDIRAWLESEPQHAFRRFLQAADDLARLPLELRVATACMPPSGTGHRGFDAALAALVEYRTQAAREATPTWVFDEWRSCPEPWCPTDDPALVNYSRRRAPEPFLRRNVLIAADDLESA